MASSDEHQPEQLSPKHQPEPPTEPADDELLRCKRSFASYCFQNYAINDSESLRRLWTRLEQGLHVTGQISDINRMHTVIILATLFEIDLFGLK